MKSNKKINGAKENRMNKTRRQKIKQIMLNS